MLPERVGLGRELPGVEARRTRRLTTGTLSIRFLDGDRRLPVLRLRHAWITGTIRTVPLTTALGAATDTFIVTNSYATIDSTILLSVTAYEGDGTPVLAVQERGNGDFSLRIGAAGAALTAPATISYLILP